MSVLRRQARAKVNPFLRVLGRRADGYHEVETLLMRIPLADEVAVRPADGVTLTVAGEWVEGVPAGEQNLAARAAAALAARCGAAGAEIELTKRIPPAAGLGGGSADAAATLVALTELWSCELGPGELRDVAAAVGSDVPGLLEDGPVIARGRGERIERVRLPETSWLVATADFGISAAEAYTWWDEDGGRTGPDPDPLLRALRAGDLDASGALLFNDLEAPILRRHPQLEGTRDALLARGAFGAIVCGSGPTVVGLVEPGGAAPLE